MNGTELRTLREGRNENQQDFASWLNTNLGRKYDKQRVSRWERDNERVPQAVVAFLSWHNKAPNSNRPKRAVTVAVANQKGGVGKTVTTINVAYALATAGYRVLIIDADSQFNASVHVGIDKKTLVRLAEEGKTLYHALLKDVNLASTIWQTGTPGLDIVPSTLLLAGADLEVAQDSTLGGAEILRRQIGPIRSSYDYILIDCAPNLGVITLSALTAADYVLVPTQVETHSIMGIDHLAGTITKVQRRANPDLKLLGIVPTQYKSRNSQDRESLEELRAKWASRTSVFEPIPERTHYPQAAAANVITMDAVPDLAGADTFRAVAQTLMDLAQENSNATA